MSGWFVKNGSESGHCCFDMSVCAHIYGDWDKENEYPLVIAETLNATEQQAHLIAAAPELYEALYRLVRDCEIAGLQEQVWLDCWISMANAALTKARGETE